MNYCPYCNWEIYKGNCSNPTGCGYKGSGQSKSERDRQAEGYQLGQLSPGDTHNGAGCYDSDTDFS
jgi:hypothetical protein